MCRNLIVPLEMLWDRFIWVSFKINQLTSFWSITFKLTLYKICTVKLFWINISAITFLKSRSLPAISFRAFRNTLRHESNICSISNRMEKLTTSLKYRRESLSTPAISVNSRERRSSVTSVLPRITRILLACSRNLSLSMATQSLAYSQVFLSSMSN